ncbi:integral membrane protein [Sesbania bispinosa]|nr:integral membrane protein [Sesbania bispinosa]
MRSEISEGNLKRRKRVGGGLEVLKAGRLEPPVAGGGAVEKVIGVLTLVVHPRRTRSQPLSPCTVHLPLRSDRNVPATEQSEKAAD